MECCLVTRSPIAGPDGNPTTQDLTLEISLAREFEAAGDPPRWP
jgi:hypothetical protein